MADETDNPDSPEGGDPGKAAETLKKAIDAALGASKKTTEQLTEQTEKLLAYAETLQKVAAHDDARAEVGKLHLEVIENQQEVLRETLKVKLADGDATNEEVAGIRKLLHLLEQRKVAINETHKIVREINEESATQGVLSDKSYKLAKKMGVALQENLGGQMALNAAFKGGMGILDKGFGKLKSGIIDVIMSVDKATKAFERQFQFGEEYTDMLVEQTKAMNEYGVSIDDVTAAHTSLAKLTTDFTMLSRAEQKVLSDTAALAHEQGVAFDDLGRGMQASMKFFGESAAGADRVSRELLSTAKALGVAPAELSSKFGTMSNQFAKFGETGVRAFKDVARISKLTGFEMEKVLALANKFDTFESAAEMTGKLNAALGGNFVNAMDMMMATDPAERFMMIKDSLDAAGLSFDDMSYYQKQFYADSLGLSDVGDLALLMSGNMDMLSGATNQSAEQIIDMKTRAQDAMNVQEAFNAIIADNADEFIGLAESLNSITKTLLQKKGIVKGLIAAYVGIKVAVFGFTMAQSMNMAAMAKAQTQLLALQTQMKLAALDGKTLTLTNQQLALSNNAVAAAGKMSGRSLMFGLVPALAAIVAVMMFASPSKLVIGMFALATAMVALGRSSAGSRIGLTALAQGLAAVAGPLAAVSVSASVLMVSFGAAAGAIGLMGHGLALMFEAISLEKMLAFVGFATALVVGAPFMVMAGLGLAAMGIGFGAMALGLFLIRDSKLRSIADFTTALSEVKVGEIRAVAKAIRAVADAMDDVPSFKAMALSLTMQSTATAAKAARALIGAGGVPAANRAAAAAGGGGGSTTHVIKIEFDNEMFKDKVVKIGDDSRAAANQAASQGRGRPVR